MPSELTVWGVGTPRTMRAHWALIEFGLDYDFHAVGRRSGTTTTPEFLALNPKHKVPVLRHGDFVLTESAAIVHHIARSFAPPPGFFLPQTDAARARLDEWCFFIMTELDALALYVIRRHLDLAEIYGEAPAAVESAKAQFADQAGAAFRDLPPGQDFLMPQGMSVADLLLVPCLYSATRRGIGLPGWLDAYWQRMRARPAWQQAFARNFPDRRA